MEQSNVVQQSGVNFEEFLAADVGGSGNEETRGDTADYERFLSRWRQRVEGDSSFFFLRLRIS